MTKPSEQLLQAEITRIALLLHRANETMLVTGAGFSTASGLPDFRGSDGLYRNRRFEEIASVTALTNEPELFWEFYRMRLDVLRTASPNEAHLAARELVRCGAIATIATQNVDGLHGYGTDIEADVLELHGSLRSARCSHCLRSEDMVVTLSSNLAIPTCECGGVMRPNIVLFGEMLPDAIEVAFSRAQHCDLMIVAGSSLAVSPVNQLPMIAIERDVPLIVINQGPGLLDDFATIRCESAVEHVFPLLEHAVSH